jgi:sensor domain CHASE-containing protein
MALPALIQLVVGIVLAIVGVWYTIETRLLRQQNAEQLELLRRQVRVQVTPGDS